MEVKTSRSGRRGANRDGHWARRHFKVIKAKSEKVKPKDYRG